MTAEEFVKERHPDAAAVKYSSIANRWAIELDHGFGRRIGEAPNRESWAWADAKRRIEKLIAAQENPVDDGEHC